MKQLFRRLPLFALVLILTSLSQNIFGQAAPKQIESFSAAEFSKLSRELSEEGGFFRSDNFTSNETAYLHIVDKLRQLGATGGAYIGVGPEQNFTYIAKIRPRIAFIIDIRRQSILQHMMYKSVFQLSATRPEFLSRLLSKPLIKGKAPAANAPINELLTYFDQTPTDEKLYTANLAAIRKMIQEDFQFPLSDKDQAGLEYIYKMFRDNGLNISYQSGSGNGGYGGGFPILKDLLAQIDLNGKQGNFLASNDDYDFVRGMHRKNLIIPVVGDFAGKKALAGIGEYLKKNGFTVTAYYTSNVEQYLFQNGVFADFVANVKKLPINDHTVFIRSASGRYQHPARLPGQRSATIMELISVFLKDFDEGKYQSYSDLILTHYISADKP